MTQTAPDPLRDLIQSRFQQEGADPLKNLIASRFQEAPQDTPTPRNPADFVRPEPRPPVVPSRTMEIPNATSYLSIYGEEPQPKTVTLPAEGPHVQKPEASGIARNIGLGALQGMTSMSPEMAAINREHPELALPEPSGTVGSIARGASATASQMIVGGAMAGGAAIEEPLWNPASRGLLGKIASLSAKVPAGFAFAGPMAAEKFQTTYDASLSQTGDAKRALKEAIAAGGANELIWGMTGNLGKILGSEAAATNVVQDSMLRAMTKSGASAGTAGFMDHLASEVATDTIRNNKDLNYDYVKNLLTDSGRWWGRLETIATTAIPGAALHGASEGLGRLAQSATAPVRSTPPWSRTIDSHDPEQAAATSAARPGSMRSTPPWVNPPEEVPNAVDNTQASSLHGDVRPQPRDGEGQVPVLEGREGIQPSRPGQQEPEGPEAQSSVPPGGSAAVQELPQEQALDPLRDLINSRFAPESPTTPPAASAAEPVPEAPKPPEATQTPATAIKAPSGGTAVEPGAEDVTARAAPAPTSTQEPPNAAPPTRPVAATPEAPAAEAQPAGPEGTPAAGTEAGTEAVGKAVQGREGETDQGPRSTVDTGTDQPTGQGEGVTQTPVAVGPTREQAAEKLRRATATVDKLERETAKARAAGLETKEQRGKLKVARGAKEAAQRELTASWGQNAQASATSDQSENRSSPPTDEPPTKQPAESSPPSASEPSALGTGESPRPEIHTPEAASPKSTTRPFTRKDLEARILDAATHTPTHDARQSQDTIEEARAEQDQNQSAGGRFTYSGDMPGELRAIVEERPDLKRFLTQTDIPSRAGWAEHYSNVGEERFKAQLEEMAGGSVDQALQDLRESPDPEHQFLAALHDNMPKGGGPAKEALKPGELPKGATFTINGAKIEVKESKDGYLVLRDGKDYPVTPVDALAEIPADKGSLKSAAKVPPEGTEGAPKGQVAAKAVSPGGKLAKAQAFFDKMEADARARMAARQLPPSKPGQRAGGTTIPDDIRDLAHIVVARLGKLGAKSAAGIGNIVKSVIDELAPHMTGREQEVEDAARGMLKGAIGNGGIDHEKIDAAPAVTEKAPEPDEGGSSTTGVAHRVTEARGIEAARGHVDSPDAAIEVGRKMLADGVTPKDILDEFNRTRSIPRAAFAVEKAELERLAKITNKAAKEHGNGSQEAKAGLEAERALVASFKPIHTAWSQSGHEQMGETDIDTGTFMGLQRAYGKEFTPKQVKEAEGIAEKSKTADATVADADKKLVDSVDEGVAKLKKERDDAIEAASQAEFEAAHERIKRQAAENALKSEKSKGPRGPGLPRPTTRKMAENVRERLKTEAASARERIRATLKSYGTTLSSGVDPFKAAGLIKDIAIVGADHIADGVVKFSEWSVKMIGSFGEGIRPHLAEFYKAAVEQHRQYAEDKAAKEAAKPTLIDRLKERAKDGDKAKDLGSYFYRMALDIVRAGTADREPMLDALHEKVKEAFPDITRTQTRDILTQYGNAKPLDMEPAKVKLRQNTGELLKTAQLEDLKKGETPKATGQQRQPLSDEARRLQKEINEAKKAAGIGVQTGPERLKTALETAKTRTLNTIKDLQAEIDTGVRIVKGKPTTISDPELEALKGRLESVRAAHEAAFGKPGLTDQQRLDLATKAAQKAADAWDQRLADAKIGKFARPGKRPLVSPEIERLRARSEAAKEAVEELRTLDPAQQASDEAKGNQQYRARMAEDVADFHDRMARGDFADKPKSEGLKLDTESQKSKAARKQARSQFEDAANRDSVSAHPVRTDMTPERVQALWEYAKKNYLDKGVDTFKDMVQGLATDFGLPPEEIRRGLARPVGAAKLITDRYAAQAAQTRIRNAAKQWVRDADTPKWLQLAKQIPRGIATFKVFGHGTVGLITHASPELFNAPEMGTWFKKYAQSFKLMGVHDEGAYHEQVMEDQKMRPNYAVARKAKLANEANDEYQDTVNIGWLRNLGLAGNRGYDVLKILRQDLFDHAWDGRPESMKTDEDAAELARDINHSTGALSKSQAGGKAAAVWFFSPKLWASRGAWLVGDPLVAAKRFVNWRNETPAARSAAWREVRQKAIMVGTYAALLGANSAILALSGSDDEINWTDPKKNDWLSFKIAGKNVGLSPMIGDLKYLCRLAIAAGGDRSKLDVAGGTRWNTMARLTSDQVRGKMSPFGKTVVDLATQSDFRGRPMWYSNDEVPKHLQKQGIDKIGWGEYAADTFLPIPLEESLQEMWKTQGMDKAQIKRWLGIVAVGASAGLTGARVSEEMPPRGRTPDEIRADIRAAVRK